MSDWLGERRAYLAGLSKAAIDAYKTGEARRAGASWAEILGVPETPIPPGLKPIPWPQPMMVPVLPVKEYTVKSGGGVVGVEYPLIHFDVVDYNEITIIARVHSANWQSGDAFKVSIYSDEYHPADPNASFIGSNSLGDANIDFGVPPLFALSTIRTSVTTIGSMIAVKVEPTSNNGYTAIVSADLVLRNS